MSTNTINQIEVNDVLYDLEDSIARNKVWEGTKEEFNAQKDSIPDGTTVLLSNDLPTGETGADQISYDNTESGLEAIDVQEAIDEISENAYSLPSGGIPKTDLSSSVQTSLGKADTALQSFTETDPTVQDWAKTGSGISVAKSVPSDAKFTDTVYTLPTATSSVLGGVKTGSNITNSSGTISLSKDNVTAALGYTPPTTNTTYSVATTSANGLMSASDKVKLNAIGTVISASITEKSVANNTYVTVATISLPANGTYIVVAYSGWSTAFDAFAGMSLTASAIINARGTGKNGGGLTATDIIQVGSSAYTCYLKVYQSSGSDRTTSGSGLKAIRIK